MPLLDSLRSRLEARGSTRGFALLRILLIPVLFYETSQGTQIHPGYFDAPLATQVLLTVMLLAVWATWIGYQTRIATALLALIYGYVHLRYGLVEFPHWVGKGSHMSQALVVLALAPSGRSLSVDRWLEVRRARRRGEPPPAEEGQVWPLELMAISLSCMYAWSAIGMLDPTWLSGEEAELLWVAHRRTSDALAHSGPVFHLGAVAIAWLALGLSCVLALGLLVPRIRPTMIIVGLVFHAGIWLTMGGWPFTYAVVASYVVLVEPARVHRFIDTIFDVPTARQGAPLHRHDLRRAHSPSVIRVPRVLRHRVGLGHARV